MNKRIKKKKLRGILWCPNHLELEDFDVDAWVDAWCEDFKNDPTTPEFIDKYLPYLSDDEKFYQLLMENLELLKKEWKNEQTN